MEVIDTASKLTKDLEIRFGSLVHDLGKGRTKKEEYPHHYGHDIKGVEPVKEMCKRIGIPKRWEKCGIVAAKEHMIGGIFNKMTIGKQVSFIERVNKSILGLDGLQIVVNSDRTRNGKEDLITPNFAEIGKKIIKEIDGEYIKKKYGINDGKKIKEKMHQERIERMKKMKYN